MWGEESCANSPSSPAAFNSDAMRLLYREGWRGVRVSRARAKEMKSPVYASLHVFSKNFRAKLDFLLRNNYLFLSNRNRLVSVVFKLYKRIISPINMTSFYITAPDKIYEYYSVFCLRLESAKVPNYPFFFGIWKGFGTILWKKGQDFILTLILISSSIIITEL